MDGLRRQAIKKPNHWLLYEQDGDTTKQVDSPDRLAASEALQSVIACHIPSGYAMTVQRSPPFAKPACSARRTS